MPPFGTGLGKSITEHARWAEWLPWSASPPRPDRRRGAAGVGTGVPRRRRPGPEDPLAAGAGRRRGRRVARDGARPAVSASSSRLMAAALALSSSGSSQRQEHAAERFRRRAGLCGLVLDASRCRGCLDGRRGTLTRLAVRRRVRFSAQMLVALVALGVHRRAPPVGLRRSDAGYPRGGAGRRRLHSARRRSSSAGSSRFAWLVRRPSSGSGGRLGSSNDPPPRPRPRLRSTTSNPAARSRAAPAPRRRAPLHRPHSDAVLARRAAAGDDDAFDKLYVRYQPRLEAYCRSIVRHDEDARDAVQNAMTKALVALRRDTDPANVQGWLFRIAHNEAISLFRRRRPTSELVDVVYDGRPGPASDLLLREELRATLAGVRALPTNLQHPLLLRELAGLSYGQVAEVVGGTPAAARKAVFDARTALSADRAGRDEACSVIRQSLSEGDGRRRRARVVRSHLQRTSLHHQTPPSASAAGSRAPFRRHFPSGLDYGLSMAPGAAASGRAAAHTSTSTHITISHHRHITRQAPHHGAPPPRSRSPAPHDDVRLGGAAAGALLQPLPGGRRRRTDASRRQERTHRPARAPARYRWRSQGLAGGLRRGRPISQRFARRGMLPAAAFFEVDQEQQLGVTASPSAHGRIAALRRRYSFAVGHRRPRRRAQVLGLQPAARLPRLRAFESRPSQRPRPTSSSAPSLAVGRDRIGVGTFGLLVSVS